MAQVLFVCDSGASIGGGHVMRCLTLAGALAREGVRATFVAPSAVDRLLDAFDTIGCGRAPAPEPRSPADLVDAAEAALAGGDYDAVVVDHFGLEAPDEARLKAPQRVVAIIDDLADRPHAADLLVDVNLGRRPADYAPLAPGAELLLGPEFALVRPEFVLARASLRRTSGPVRRALVSLGLTDVGGITERVVSALGPVLGGIEIDVVVGAAARSLGALQARAERGERVRLHVETAAMAELMLQADVAVGAGGSSTWERACLALPTLTLVLADNQEPGTTRLVAAGAALAMEARGADLTGLPPLFERLVREETLRAALSQRSAELCDGEGAARVAARLRARLGSPTGR